MYHGCHSDFYKIGNTEFDIESLWYTCKAIGGWIKQGIVTYFNFKWLYRDKIQTKFTLLQPFWQPVDDQKTIGEVYQFVIIILKPMKGYEDFQQKLKQTNYFV